MGPTQGTIARPGGRERLIGALRHGTWLTWDRIRIAAVLSGIGYFVSFVAVQFLPSAYMSETGVLMMDYLSFWMAGHQAVVGMPQLAYIPAEFAALQKGFSGSETVFAFFYPPMYQLMLMPFGLLDYQPSFFLFAVATTLLFLIALKSVIGSWRYALCLVMVPACANNFMHGQNAALSAALLTFFLLALERSRPLASGMALAILTFKPQLGLLVPFLLLAGRHYSVFLWASAASVILAGISFVVLGQETWLAFIEQIPVASQSMAEGWVEWGKMISLYGGLRVLGLGHEVAMAFQVGVALLALVMGILVWMRSKDLSVRVSTLVGGTLLSTPFALSYDATLVIVPIAFVLREGLRSGFLPFEKSVVAIVVVLSASTSAVAMGTGVPLAPLLSGAVLWLGLRRLKRAPVGSIAPAY